VALNLPVSIFAQETPTDTAISTGDIQAEIGADNQVNTNITDFSDQPEEIAEPAIEEQATETEVQGPEAVCEVPPVEEQTTEEQTLPETEVLPEPEEELVCPVGQSVVDQDGFFICNDNQADIANQVGVAADTGSNEASSSTDAFIETGDVTITTNISNTANTNIVGANFWYLILNYWQDLIGNIAVDQSQTNQNAGCQLIDCVNDLEVNNNNQANLVNDVQVYAMTGNNQADNNDGNASINTGDIEVTTNIVNMLNTNITGMDWIYAIINSFGNWIGNLIFPGVGQIEQFTNGSAADQLESEAQTEDVTASETDSAETAEANTCSEENCTSIDIENNNQADIQNNINVIADTGSNQANGNGGNSVIVTGDANVDVNIANNLNTNIIGSNWMMIAIKIFGDWNGQVFSLPPGTSWLRTPDGILIFSDGMLEQAQSSGLASPLSIINNNTSTVQNNLNIFASTGSNTASGNGNNASIETGNADVSANIANFVNTNIIGRNWLMAMINVFGDWDGNVAFGQPDLWLGASAVTAPAPAVPGGLINYTLSYTNSGNADATNVVLTDDFDERYLTLADLAGGVLDEGRIKWNLGTVPVGATAFVTYAANIKSDLPEGRTYLQNTASIESLEEDQNNENNTESLTVQVDTTRTYATYSNSNYIPPQIQYPYIKVNKTNDSKGPVKPHETVKYKIVLTNDGNGSAYDVIVHDTLTDPFGKIVKTFDWDLQEVYAHEEINIDYSLLINGYITLGGIYTNTVSIEGKNSQGNSILIMGGQKSSKIEVILPEKKAGDFANQQDCQEANFFWYDDTCHSQPKPEEIILPLQEIAPLEKIVRQITDLPQLLDTESANASIINRPVLKVDARNGKDLGNYLTAGLASLLSSTNFWLIIVVLMAALLTLMFLRRRNAE